MSPDVDALLKLEVPVLVVLARRTMHVKDVTTLVQGAIIELPKNAEDDLELLVNNKPIGLGRAVKVGENFGLRVTYIGDLRERLNAVSNAPAAAPAAGGGEGDLEALAAQMLSGQV